MNTQHIIDRKFKLERGERMLCLACAESAMGRLRRNHLRDGLFSLLRTFGLMWCLSSYALFLREVVAGRRIRYGKLAEIAVAGAALMGDSKIIEILSRNGIEIAAVRWSRRQLAPFTLAALAGGDEFARKLLEDYPEMLSRGNVEENVKVCVSHGGVKFVEFLLAKVFNMCGDDVDLWDGLLSRALFSAVANDRRETIDLILRWGVDGTWSKTDGCFPAHLASSLFSCAVDNKNYSFADFCIAKGWLPAEDEVSELPNSADALEDLEKFEYLCRSFPTEDYRQDVLDYWSKHYDVSPAVYAFCGGHGVPCQDDVSSRIDNCTDEEILSDCRLFEEAVRRNPDRVFDLAALDVTRVREHFSHSSLDGLCHSPYIFRKAKSIGLDLFDSKESERRFVESIPWWSRPSFREHQLELGWLEYDLSSDRLVPDCLRSEEEERFDCAAKARGEELRRILDDPEFDPNSTPFGNWSFAQAVCTWGNPGTFRKWALRGMDTYGQNAEGNYAIDGAEMPTWCCLVTEFGMNPMHVAYDGSSALGDAIALHQNETAKWLWLHGDQTEWEGSSPLRIAILNCNDELAAWFRGQGCKNVDGNGREYPIPNWV